MSAWRAALRLAPRLRLPAPRHPGGRQLCQRPTSTSGFASSSAATASAAPRCTLCSSSAAPATEPWARVVGEGGLLLRFGTGVDEAVNKEVLACMAAIDHLEEWPDGLMETLPTYASLMLHFDPVKITADEVERWALSAYAAGGKPDADAGADAAAVVEIPVYYGSDSGPDIDVAAETAGVSTDEVCRWRRRWSM